MNTTASVVIGTRNRSRKLVTTIAHLRAMVVSGPWELIVVDNGSTDDTVALCREAIRDFPVEAQLLEELRPGVASARNRGALVATGAVLVFIDDDCYAAPTMLDRLVARFEEAPIAFLGGRVLLHNPDDIPVTIRSDEVDEWLPPHVLAEAGVLHGACMAFRRTALQQVGLFDPLLGPGTSCGSGEDTELFGRCSFAGWSGLYAHDVIVEHDHGRRTPDEAWALQVAYALGRGGCYASLLLRGCPPWAVLRVWLRTTRGKWRWLGRIELRGALNYVRGLARHRRLRPVTPRLPASLAPTGRGTAPPQT